MWNQAFWVTYIPGSDVLVLNAQRSTKKQVGENPAAAELSQDLELKHKEPKRAKVCGPGFVLVPLTFKAV